MSSFWDDLIKVGNEILENLPAVVMQQKISEYIKEWKELSASRMRREITKTVLSMSTEEMELTDNRLREDIKDSCRYSYDDEAASMMLNIFAVFIAARTLRDRDHLTENR